MKRMIYTLCALLLLCSTFLFVSCDDDIPSTPSTPTPSMPTHVCSGEWSTYEATCTSEGSRSRICTSCGKYEQETIPMLDHAYTEDNFCEQCHVMKAGTYTEGLEYSFSEWSSTCSVTDVGSAENETEIIIPTYYNGKKVTSIGAGAFLGCSNLKSIDIPRTVDSIGEGAFSGCSALETMRIPTIGGDANDFYEVSGFGGYYFGNNPYPNSVQITQISHYYSSIDYKWHFTSYNAYVPSSLKTIILTGSTDDWLQSGSFDSYDAKWQSSGAFEEFPIETVIIESTVSSLTGGFQNCKNLKKVIFTGNSVLHTLGGFSGCTSLTTITMPNSVKILEDGCFMGCTALENVILSNSLTTISEKCFDGCTALKNIDLPNTLKTIEEAGWTKGTFGIDRHGDAFRNCTSLTEITLPKSLKEIGMSSFYGCVNLKTVYNKSGLYLQKGSETHGGVAYYAETIINK